MTRLWCAVALGLLAVGCATENDQPPWKRGGLMGNAPPGMFDEAIKDARGDNQRMSASLGTPDHPAGPH